MQITELRPPTRRDRNMWGLGDVSCAFSAKQRSEASESEEVIPICVPR